MKESTLIEMKNRVEILGNAVSRLLHEMEQLKTLSIGNMELLKLMPGYEEALSVMKEKQEENSANGFESTDS